MYKHIMLEIYQKTLCNQFSFEGIGLHNGENSKVTVKPSDANSGIVFKRVDIEKNNIIEADFKYVRLSKTLHNS